MLVCAAAANLGVRSARCHARRALSTMPRRIDPYAVLGVEHGCTAADLKAAYLKRAMQYHPDRNPEVHEVAEAKFKEIAEAYNVLSEAPSRHGKARSEARTAAGVSRKSAEQLFWRLHGDKGAPRTR